MCGKPFKTLKAASVNTLKIRVDQNCLFALYNWIRDKADDFVPPKTCAEQYAKLLNENMTTLVQPSCWTSHAQ